jgi:hypothetical protein
MEHVLDGLPGGAHRGETGPVDGLNDGITAPEHLDEYSARCTASSFTGFPAPVLSLQTRRECASQEVATQLQIERSLP